MDEYISKTKFEELMRKKARSNFDLYYVDKEKHYHDKAIGYNTAADEAHDFPTADVQSVKHGRWITMDDVEHFIAVCSECGRTEDSRDIKDMLYCHCGARMDGDNNA